MDILSRVFCCWGLILAALAGQSQPAANAPPAGADELAALVKRQFGASFTLPAKFPTPLVTADFDGDGIADAVIVADSKEPLPDSFAFKYEVADPYDAFFGAGDANVTASFGAGEPHGSHDLLVILGAGAEGWRAATPKAKFVIINLPFDTIEVGRMLLKKKKPPVFVIKAHEAEIMSSAVYWDGKKWKWQPGDTVN